MRLLIVAATSSLLLGMVSLPVRAADGKMTCTADEGGKRSERRYAEFREETLSPTGSERIRSSPNGGMSVHGWDQNQVKVTACVKTSAPSDAEAKSLASQVKITQGAGSIQATGPDHLSSDRHWSVSYEIWAPRRSNLEMQTTNGGISADGIDGQVNAENVNGGIRLEKMAGSVDAQTTNGGIHVTLDGNQWQGDGVKLSAVNGGIHLSVPENYSAKVQISTVNGGFHSDFAIPVSVDGRSQKHMSFQLGSGGTTLQASTVNGGISLSRAD
jgi:Putative adhesin